MRSVERLGFKLEGTLRERFFVAGEIQDSFDLRPSRSGVDHAMIPEERFTNRCATTSADGRLSRRRRFLAAEDVRLDLRPRDCRRRGRDGNLRRAVLAARLRRRRRMSPTRRCARRRSPLFGDNPRFRTIAAPAEATTLPGSSVDAVVAAASVPLVRRSPLPCRMPARAPACGNRRLDVERSPSRGLFVRGGVRSAPS
jgi:hypothetical protein